jgi:hypothetical protein
MRERIYHICQISLLLLLSLPLPALAIPAITCHCFTDRSYDPARPALADPYFLATTQNAFFALVFNLDKATIVMKKQQGTPAADLWIAYWLATKGGKSAEALLQAKQRHEHWQEVVAPLRLAPKTLGSRFSAALQANGSATVLADGIVDELFSHYRLLSDGELAELRQSGATNQELIIATLIAGKVRQPARQVYREVKSGASTWGRSLQQARIDPKRMEQELGAILNIRPLQK